VKSVSVLFTSPLEDSCILSPNFSHFSFERIIYNQLSSYLSENNISYQSGLSLNVTALLEVTDNGAFNIDRGSVIAVVFLDLTYADKDICSIEASLSQHLSNYKLLAHSQ